SRVVGYLRPIKQWNDGKQAEFRRRKTFHTELPESMQPTPARAPSSTTRVVVENCTPVDCCHHLTA
ncbi:MAG: anaerobic ribonucleoside-triphosphate reductase, partial [Desulfobacterales bacterium]